MVYDSRGHMRTQTHRNLGGRNGPPGYKGRNGNNANNGSNGLNGCFRISVNKDGVGCSETLMRNWLKVIAFDIVYSDDLVFEPGEVSCINH